MTTTARFPVGSYLPNGALVLASKPATPPYYVVLALVNLNAAHPEFVVWKVANDTAEAFWGDYCDLDLAEALAAFEERD